MKIDSTHGHTDREPIDLEKWQQERLAFMQNSPRQYDKLAIRFQKEMIAKFASDDEDAKMVRDWLAKRKIVEYWPDDSFEERLTYLFLLVVGALSETYQVWDLTPTVRKRAHLMKVKKAANRLADLLEPNADQPAPPMPPLWYFLSDSEAESLLTVVDRSRTHRESVNVLTMLTDIKRANDWIEAEMSKAADPLAADTGGNALLSGGSRKYQLARHLYNHYGMPERWQSYGHDTDTPFLDADSAMLIRRLGEYHASLPLDGDSTHNDDDRQIKLFAKKVFLILNESFDADERPHEPTAAIVRLHFPSRNERDEDGDRKGITDKWVEILARNL